MFYAETLSERYGADIYFKHEDLLHGSAHKLNNALGQALLAKRAGKKRLIGETGAGQHGTATAMAGALLDVDTTVYMGRKDIGRQRMNVFRMRLVNAVVEPVTRANEGLAEAVDAAMEDLVDINKGIHGKIPKNIFTDGFERDS